jgi:hypothetical protein
MRRGARPSVGRFWKHASRPTGTTVLPHASNALLPCFFAECVGRSPAEADSRKAPFLFGFICQWINGAQEAILRNKYEHSYAQIELSVSPRGERMNMGSAGGLIAVSKQPASGLTGKMVSLLEAVYAHTRGL